MRKIKLVIPNLTHPSLNDWTKLKWYAKRDIKEEWDKEIREAVRKERRLPFLPMAIKKASITIKYYFKVKRPKRDYDNYSPKFIMDGLVGRVIQDDRDDWVKVDWKILVDKDSPRTEIMVEERK